MTITMGQERTGIQESSSSINTVISDFEMESNRHIEATTSPIVSRYRYYSFLGGSLMILNGLFQLHIFGLLVGSLQIFQNRLNVKLSLGGLIMVCANLVAALFSCMTLERLEEHMGERFAVLVTGISYIVSAISLTLDDNIYVLLAACVSLCVSLGYNMIPTYVNEVCASKRRWFTIIIPDTSTKVGGIISFILLTSLHISWTGMAYIAIAPPLLTLIILYFMPESPRWLIMKGRTEEGLKVLIVTSVDDVEVDLRIKKFCIDYPEEESALKRVRKGAGRQNQIEDANAFANLQELLHQKEQAFHELEMKFDEKDRELHAVTLVYETKMQEQHKAAQKAIMDKDEQLREAQACISRIQEINAWQSTTIHKLQAESRERTEQYNQNLLACQRQDLPRWQS